MTKQAFFINISAQRWYKFHAPVGAYPEALGIGLGVSVSIPDGHRSTTIGTFADYGIAKVRIKLANGESRVRLCDTDMLSTAIADLPGAEAFGSVIEEVSPIRRYVYVQ